MRLTAAQAALLQALQRGVRLAPERMLGRHKAQSRVTRSDTGEDVTSVANALRDRGSVRHDYTLVTKKWPTKSEKKKTNG